VSGDEFLGTNAETVFGSVPHVAPDREHWAQGTTLVGTPTSMQPNLVPNVRYGYSELDYAALKDIGWDVAPAAVTPVSAGMFTPVVADPSNFTALSGLSGGTGQLFH